MYGDEGAPASRIALPGRERREDVWQVGLPTAYVEVSVRSRRGAQPEVDGPPPAHPPISGDGREELGHLARAQPGPRAIYAGLHLPNLAA